jgi:hypothetical protein
MHLNKLIVRDFPRNTTMEQDLTKYRLLNVFYNRDREIEFLEKLAAEEKPVKERGWKVVQGVAQRTQNFLQRISSWAGAQAKEGAQESGTEKLCESSW